MVRQCACVAPDLMWVARLLARFRVRAPRRPSVGERPVSDAPDFVGPSQPLELGRRGRARRAVRAVAQRGAHGRQRRHARRRARGLRAAAARAAAAAEARVCAEEEARGRGNGSEARQSASACLVGAAGCPALLGQPQPGAREEGCGGGGRCLLASPPPRVRCASRTHAPRLAMAASVSLVAAACAHASSSSVSVPLMAARRGVEYFKEMCLLGSTRHTEGTRSGMHFLRESPYRT